MSCRSVQSASHHDHVFQNAISSIQIPSPRDRLIVVVGMQSGLQPTTGSWRVGGGATIMIGPEGAVRVGSWQMQG